MTSRGDKADDFDRIRPLVLFSRTPNIGNLWIPPHHLQQDRSAVERKRSIPIVEDVWGTATSQRFPLWMTLEVNKKLLYSAHTLTLSAL